MKAIIGAFNKGTVKSNIDSSWSGPAQCSTRLASTGDSLAWEERTDWAPLPIFVSGKLEEINSPASVMSQGGTGVMAVMVCFGSANQLLCY